MATNAEPPAPPPESGSGDAPLLPAFATRAAPGQWRGWQNLPPQEAAG